MKVKITLLAAAIIACGLVPVHGQGISTTNLRQYLETLFNGTRSALSTSEKIRVRDGINASISSTINSLPAASAQRISIITHGFTAPNTNNYQGLNLVMIIKGDRFNTTADEPILIGSHYDTSQVSTTIGTDDNGSGMAAALEIVKALLTAMDKCTFLNTIVAVAFDLEEEGLYGSAAYAEQMINTYLQPMGVTNFQGAFIMDTVMNFDQTPNSQDLPTGFNLIFPAEDTLIQQNSFRGDAMVVIGRQDDSAMMALLNQEWYAVVGGNFTSTAKYRMLRLPLPLSGSARDFTNTDRIIYSNFFRSDHYSFWNIKNSYTQTGLRAVFLTDTADFRGIIAHHEAMLPQYV